MAPMAVLSVFVLWLVLAAATEQRRGEVAVARLRGRGPAGAVGLLLIELLPVLLVGVVPRCRCRAPRWGAGPGAAARSGSRSRRALGSRLRSLLAVVAVVLTTVAAAVRVAREPLDALMRRGRVPSRRWALGALDAFLIAGVGTGVLRLRHRKPQRAASPLLGRHSWRCSPACCWPTSPRPLRARSGRRLLRRGRLVAGVTLLETGRRRETRAVIAVITVASALAVFAVDALVVGERNRINASEHDAGAPVGAPPCRTRPGRRARGAGARSTPAATERRPS